ncbi:MAG TPA: RDD family protein, partial [Steroidobacteraceae bacterium]|nr:RDD family protein [Steroidobacteraceae bacterium]
AGLPRRLAALFYDSLLLLALLMIVTACFLPFTGGEAVTWERSPVLYVLYQAALVGVTVAFYGVFWTRQGHTLGMATWRLRVERLDGSLLTWPDAVVRLVAAVLSWLPAGLGWFWSLVDREHRTWHDMLSHTRVVVEPRPRDKDRRQS